MTHHRTLSIAALLLLLTLASNPSAQRYDDAAAVAPEVPRLKSAYLRCDQSATERLLDGGEAANCSLVHELLLRLGFGGDFERLLAWWRAERAAAAAARRDAQVAAP